MNNFYNGCVCHRFQWIDNEWMRKHHENEHKF